MKALMPVALLMGLVSQHACVDAADTEPELGEHQQAEIIEIHGGCPPGTIGNGQICVDPLEGGGTGGGGEGPGPVGGEGGPGGPGGAGPHGGGGSGGGSHDPEPDHDKDRKSCHDWCAWDWRQCRLECKHRHPDRDFNERNRCFLSCDRKVQQCKADCNSRFPERPITTVAP